MIQSINRFKMAAIVRFDLDVPEKGPFYDKLIIYKCISANDMQIHQQKGDMPTFICNDIHADQS